MMMAFSRPRAKTRTFKPKKDVPEGTKQYQLRKYAEATLVRASFLFLSMLAFPWFRSGGH
jgi:hypothetical protein